jgi:hypothetical protein
MVFRRVCTVVLIAVFGIGAVPAWSYSGGAGTSQDPYQISTAEDLIQLGRTFDGYGLCYVLTQDLDLSAHHFSQAVVARALWPTEYQMERDAFTGSFDGQGHVVRHMSIQGQGWLGLFGGLARGGVVCNVRLEHASVSSTGDQTGALIALNEGLVLNCSVQGEVHGQALIGGLIGLNKGSVVNCYSNVVVTGSGGIGGLVGTNEYGMVQCAYSLGSVSGFEHAGGLVGRNWGGIVSDTYSAASVTGQFASGGLVGDNPGPGEGYPEGTVVHSFWDSEVSGPADSGAGTGLTTPQMESRDTFLSAGWDFVHERANGTCETWSMPDANGPPQLQWFQESSLNLQGSGLPESPYIISNASDLGRIMYAPAAHYRLSHPIDLTGIQWARAVVPFFAGVLDGNHFEIQALSLTGGAYMGLIGTLGIPSEVSHLSLADVNMVDVKGAAGALAARNRGTVTQCYSSGVVRGIKQAGGLVGVNEGLIRQSFSLATVHSIHRAGGLVGDNWGEIETSYATGAIWGQGLGAGGVAGVNQGSISQCFATGAVTGTNSVAGLVGTQIAGQISQCYSTGRVIGATSTGGLIGASSGTVESSFWEINTSIKVTSAGGAGKYSSQMAEVQTFLDAGWDFSGDPDQGVDPVWYMTGSQPRPALLATGRFCVNAQSSPGGSVIQPGQGVYDYAYDTVLTVQAQAEPHYTFLNWSGSIAEQGWLSDPNAAMTSLQILGAGHLLAFFAVDLHTMTIGYSDHGKITEPNELSGVYAYGTQIPVSAKADDGYFFAHWQAEGDVAVDHVNDPNTVIHVLGDGSVYAQFALQVRAYIPDPSLKAAIEAALGTEDVTINSMKALTRLEVIDANVSDLTGLEHATNLTYLDLTGNDIIDIDAIGALTKLTTLSLGQNRIVDCSPLVSLAQLDRVFLNDNRIFDVGVFAGMTRLTLVDLNHNMVYSIESFAQCSLLQEARLNYNQISSISPLVGLERLGWLSLIGNPLDNVTIQEWSILKYTVEQKNLGKIIVLPFPFAG